MNNPCFQTGLLSAFMIHISDFICGWIHELRRDLFLCFFLSGDVFNADWDGLLNGVTAVVSTIGGFGNNEQMEKINGDANLVAVNAASDAGLQSNSFNMFIY